MNILKEMQDKVYDAMLNNSRIGSLTIIIPSSKLGELRSCIMSVTGLEIKDTSGLKIFGNRVITSPDINEIEVL